MNITNSIYDIKSGALTLLLLCPLFVTAENNESYPVVNSNTILSSGYLSSTYHRVDSVDINNDFYHFLIESDIGQYDVSSLALLTKRVNEIKTVSRAINRYKQQDAEFSGELRSQLTLSGDSAVDFFTSPLNTASNIAGQLADNLNATFAGEDPFLEDQSNRLSFNEPSDPTTAAHKRNIAFQLGLDMYTSNMKVQSFLNAVANARASGKISAGIGLSDDFTDRASTSALDLEIRYLMKNKTVSELNDYNSERLIRIGVRPSLIKTFIDNPILSPTNKTTIATYLSKLEHVSRLDAFIALALTAKNEVMALVYERMSKVLWQYNNNTEAFSAFYNYKGQVAVITKSRRIVFFDIADLLIWSEDKQKQYEQSAKHAESSGYKGWEIVSLGNVSSMASQKISDLTFKLQTSIQE